MRVGTLITLGTFVNSPQLGVHLRGISDQRGSLLDMGRVIIVLGHPGQVTDILCL